MRAAGGGAAGAGSRPARAAPRQTRARCRSGPPGGRLGSPSRPDPGPRPRSPSPRTCAFVPCSKPLELRWPLMPSRPFYGWYPVVGLGVTTIVSYGISQYLFGVLVVPIQADLHWSRATISGAYSLGLILSGFLGLAVGRLIDRYGARTLMSAGSVLGGLTLFLLSRVTEVWQFYLLWAGFLGVAMALTLYSVTFVVIANWFQRRRGTAMAPMSVVGGLTSPIYIPFAGLLVARLGWRSALLLLGGAPLVLPPPVHPAPAPRPPRAIGLPPARASN